jgi:hypothetical protein
MNKTGAVVFVAGVLLLSGCLYEVGIPDKPVREIDRAFLGTWEFQAPKAPKGGQMEISERDKNHYKIVLTTPALSTIPEFPELSGPLEMTAFHAKVGAIDVVALHALRGPPAWSGRYQFFRYTNDGPDTLLLSSLNADLVKRDIRSQDELIRQITNAAGDANLFRRDIVPAKRVRQPK